MSWISRVAGRYSQSEKHDAEVSIRQLIDFISDDAGGYIQDETIRIEQDHIEIGMECQTFVSSDDVMRKHHDLTQLLNQPELNVHYSRSILHEGDKASDLRSEITIPISSNGGLKEITKNINSFLRQERLHDSQTWVGRDNARTLASTQESSIPHR